MSGLDRSSFSVEERWAWAVKEYESRNPIARHLVEGFFSEIQHVLTGLEPTDSVLEVGCGPGVSSRRIRAMLPTQSFEASEFDPVFVERLRAMKVPFQVREESVLSMQRPDRSFDCVMLLEVLEHLDDFERALTELFRVSRKYVVLSVPNEPLWRVLNMIRGRYLRDWGNTPTHVNHWSRRRLAALVNTHGTVVEVRAPIPWLVVLARVPTYAGPASE